MRDQGPVRLPALEADNQVRTDAPRGTFPYRISGSSTGADGTGPFSETVAHTVAPEGVASDGTRTFTETYTQSGVQTVATYKARASEGVSAGNVGTEASLGEVELSSIVSRTTTGAAASFTPAGSGLRILQLRAADGLAWRDASDDPLSQSTLTIDAKVVSRSVVDAVGSPSPPGR